MEKKFENFNALEVSLSGRNLVEASAGTGKTFSIAILVLRLILEEGIDIKKILLVTFTNNAVAELEERIRLFVREAYNLTEYNKEAKPLITAIVNKSINEIGAELTKERLSDALLFLDELSVMTIHKFCEQTLRTQAFETGQLFGAEITQSLDEIFELYSTDFWRTKINTLPLEVFKTLRDAMYSVDNITGIVKRHFSNKPLFVYDKNKNYNSELPNFITQTLNLSDSNQFKQDFENYLSENKEEILAAMNSDANAKKQINKIDNVQEMWELVSGKQIYIGKVFGNNLLTFVDRSREAENQQKSEKADIVNYFYCYAIENIVPKVEAHLKKSGLISTDGLIFNLHTAIMGDNKNAITKGLKNKYKAVFVDEFQDTDKLQFDIFNTAFASETILFYIGDPKQSIYSFRQADINTYLESYNSVDKLHSMNTNFRSSPRYLAALNKFFLPYENFDTFYFKSQEGKNKQEEGIEYIEVEASNIFGNKDLFHKDKPVSPLTVIEAQNNSVIFKDITYKIVELLTNENYEIKNGEESRRIKPSDIAIIVKSNSKAKELKNYLNTKNVPAVLYQGDKVMQSKEANIVYYILKAFYTPTFGNINTALFNYVVNWRSDDLRKYKKEELIELFRKYNSLWETKGIYHALTTFINDFGINGRLSAPNVSNGLRTISNLTQIKELLNNVEYYQHLNPAELIDWLERASDSELVPQDENQLRLENDADSVTIITVHKAKGLQYNIVFAPQTDFILNNIITKQRHFWGDFYDKESSKYLSIPMSQIQLHPEKDEQIEIFKVQENRRLLYVTLTRGVYASFAYISKWREKNSTTRLITSALSYNTLLANEKLLNNKKTNESAEETLDVRLQNQGIYTADTIKQAKKTDLKNGISLLEPDWQTTSYSGLSANIEHSFRPQYHEKKQEDSDYDKFIFGTLKRSSITGLLLHEIFEKINFYKKDEYNERIINNAITKYASSQTETYNDFIPILIDHVLNANIETKFTNFKLKETSSFKQLHELEFDFPINKLSPKGIISICKRYGVLVQISEYNEIYGMLRGFIDLIFEHKGRFYILDWKSNFLGNTISDYENENLSKAMESNNYHLQYLIYTVATVKYLKLRKPDFDYYKHFGGVIYCYLRGMREEQNSGVFYNLPEKYLIEKLLRDFS